MSKGCSFWVAARKMGSSSRLAVSSPEQADEEILYPVKSDNELLMLVKRRKTTACGWERPFPAFCVSAVSDMLGCHSRTAASPK